VSFIKEAMEQSSVTSDCLELEITEGVLLAGSSFIDDALGELSEIGVSIAMDDFGTGYSSLSYLRRYPFDVLKIDRSFISDITVDQADRELINAAIAMAHGLNLKVVAEGVETEAQLNHLKEQNCDYAQGYFFSQPVSPEVLTMMLEPAAGKSSHRAN
jgi:EAL domain-containing protein (putative c-di-GMP-specific phosphodiesterase class I)